MGWKTNPIQTTGLLPNEAGQPPADAPLTNNPVPNEPLPLARTPGGVLGSLRRKRESVDTAEPTLRTVIRERMRRFARPNGKTVSNAFGSKRTISPTPASPDFKLDHDDLRAPKAPGGQTGVDHQRTKNAQALVKNVDGNAPSGPDILSDRSVASTHIRNSFAHRSLVDQWDAYDFSQEILNTFEHDNRAQAPHLKAILVTNALVEVSGRDLPTARNAFRALRGRAVNPDEDTQRRAFALQRELALDPNGFQALLDAAPHSMPAPQGQTKTERRIHGDAQRETLRAAHDLMKAWPRGYPAPNNLDELVAIANLVLPDEERTSFSWFQPAVDEPVRQALLSQPQTLRALVAGATLMQNPQATPPAALRAAYFAFRNNISEEDLPKIRSRTFRIVHYAQLNVRNAKAESWLKTVGTSLRAGILPKREIGDTPLAAFELGTGGVFLDHPDKDFGQAHAIDIVLDALNKIIVNEPPRIPGEMPSPEVVRAAVRAAVCRRWKEKITTKGWRDDMRFGKFESKKIMRDVAAALNLDYKFVLKNRRAFQVPPMMNFVHLDAWATQAGADRNQVISRSHRSHATVGIAPKTLGECLDRGKRIRDDGRRPPQNAQENFDTLRDVVKYIPDTWAMLAANNRSSGLSTLLTANSDQNLGTPALPVYAALLPDFAYVRGRTNIIEIGSSAHVGQITIGTAERRLVNAGVGAYAGASDGAIVASINGGVSFGSEHILERGVVFRSRLEDLDDPTNKAAWRKTLQRLLAAMSNSGPSGGLPTTDEEMWNAIVDEFYKDPDLSVNWIERDASTQSASAALAAGLRLADHRGNKTGVFLTGGASGFRTSETRRDSTGNQTVSTDVQGKGGAINASAAAVVSFEAINANMGPIASTSVPSLPMAAVSTPLFTRSTHSVLRGFYEDGLIIPEKSFVDTQFSRPKDFHAYIDNNNEEWSEALGGQRKLDEFTTKAQLSTLQGNRAWGERRQLTKEAAERINAHSSVLRAYGRSTRELSPQDKRIVANTRRKLAAEFENKANFRPLLLYSYENNSVAKTRGLNFLFVSAQTISMNGEREIAFVRAHAHHHHPPKTHE